MYAFYIFALISYVCLFFFSSRRRHTRWPRDWSSDVCSSDLELHARRQIVWRHSKRLLQTPHRFVVSSETLQHDRVEIQPLERSEERRVGKECRSRWSPYQ